MQSVPLGAAGDHHLSAVRHDSLPEADLLQAAERLRGSGAFAGMRRRHRHLPGGNFHLHHSHQGQEGLSLGVAVLGRFRRGGP